ncbi:hypothetical protein B194_4316 [Serratia plymuthica A30]|nr:hypothetical protein B194_4316 [Serratia plymuthica A30]
MKPSRKNNSLLKLADQYNYLHSAIALLYPLSFIDKITLLKNK